MPCASETTRWHAAGVALEVKAMQTVESAAAAHALEACPYTPTSERKPTPYSTHTTTTVTRISLHVRCAVANIAGSLLPTVCRDIRCIHN